MRDDLSVALERTHDVLALRLDHARAALPTRERPRDRFPATDRFLASTSRHVAAATTVLVPVVARTDEGHAPARAFLGGSRVLEEALYHAKGKLYGSTYQIRRPWPEVWEEVQDGFDAYWSLEAELLHLMPAEADRTSLAERLYRAELRSPTRPHPFLPHAGLAGRAARGVARRVDGFWDTAEGRMIPEPVRAERRDHGPLALYLLGDARIGDGHIGDGQVGDAQVGDAASGRPGATEDRGSGVRER